MIAPWRSLDRRRADSCVWTRAAITIGFRDHADLSWVPREDGYQHHARPPAGVMGRQTAVVGDLGGVMHLQFADWPRLVAKHALYQIREATRWPGRLANKDLRAKYSQATDEVGVETLPIPDDWWGPERQLIRLGQEPWQAAEARRLAAEAAAGQLDGLDLMGVL